MAEVRKFEGYTLLFLEILIIILNALAIIVILRFKKKYNPDILIFTLAVADVLKAFIPLNMTLFAYLGGKAMTEGSLSCMIFGWTAFTLNSGIMLVMTVMAIDRYVAICRPFRYKHYLSKKRLIYTIIAVFVFSGLHSMLPLIGVGQMRSYNNGSFCHFDFDSTVPACLGYSIFVLVLGISMLVVVIFCYTRAMFSIRGLIRRQRRMSTSTQDIDNADQKRQAMNRMFARLMIVMMMAFCLSWLLFLIVVLQHVSGWFDIPPDAHFWSMRLVGINSAMNPIIGAAMCRPYRRGYMFILCKCLQCCGLCSSYNAEGKLGYYTCMACAAMCRPYRRGYVFILCKCLHCCGLCSSYNAEGKLGYYTCMACAAMCRPYRRRYMFILCKCLHCCGLCSSYKAEDPWTRSRKMSVGSRNSSGDQNEPNTCETVKSPSSKKMPNRHIRNNPSFNSYHDSGIVPDSSDYPGTLGYHQAGVLNDVFEMDTNLAGDGRFKARPGLTRKRISFKDEVEAKQIAGMLLSGEEAVEPKASISDTTNPQQHSSLSMSGIPTDPPTNQDEINGTENAPSKNQPTYELASSVDVDSLTAVSLDGNRRRKFGFSDYDQSSFETLEPSSLERPPGNSDAFLTSNGNLILKEGRISEEKTTHGVKTPLQNSVSQLMFNNEQAAKYKLPKGFISNKTKPYQIEREKSLSEKSEQRQLTSAKDRYRGASQTVHITHFPVGTNSDITTTTNVQRSKSSHAFLPYSLRGSSFIERTRKTSLQGQKARSRSFANDFSAVEANGARGMVHAPENTTQKRQEPHEHSIHPTTPKRTYGTETLLDTQRLKSDEALHSELLPNLSRTKSFESILSNTRCKLDSTAYVGLDLPPFQRHLSSFKGGLLKGTYNWSYSEPDLTRTVPSAVFLTSPCTAGQQSGSVICGPQNERYKETVHNGYQRRVSSPQAMPLPPSKIYRQLSELSQIDLEREVFC